ncbi:hypothetical protein D9M72_538770 [compost metagenome]
MVAWDTSSTLIGWRWPHFLATAAASAQKIVECPIQNKKPFGSKTTQSRIISPVRLAPGTARVSRSDGISAEAVCAAAISRVPGCGHSRGESSGLLGSLRSPRNKSRRNQPFSPKLSVPRYTAIDLAFCACVENLFTCLGRTGNTLSL